MTLVISVNVIRLARMSGLERKALIERCLSGEKFEYCFFGGVEETWCCFSQFYGASFTIDGIWYRTAEHFYMAEKARMFGDEESLTRIIAVKTPKKAKFIGKKIKGFDRDRWLADGHARGVVLRGNIAKFTNPENAEIRDILLSTGDAILVEASQRDCIWGIGMTGSDDRASTCRGGGWNGSSCLRIKCPDG